MALQPEGEASRIQEGWEFELIPQRKEIGITAHQGGRPGSACQIEKHLPKLRIAEHPKQF